MPTELVDIAGALAHVGRYGPHAVVGVFGDGSAAVLRLHFTESATAEEVNHVRDRLLEHVPLAIMLSTSVRAPKVPREVQLRDAMDRGAAARERRRVERLSECGAPNMTCGGDCTRPRGHEPPCWCEGIDENGEETCPA